MASKQNYPLGIASGLEKVPATEMDAPKAHTTKHDQLLQELHGHSSAGSVSPLPRVGGL